MLYIISFFLIAIVLMFLEAYLPGGILGTIGSFFIIASVYCIYKQYGVSAGILGLIIEVILSIGFIFLAIRLLPHTKTGKNMILEKTQENYQAGDDKLKDLLNKTGIAKTTLRPAGTAEIDKQRVDVVTEGVFIEQGSIIKVIEVHGNRVIVQKI